MSRSFLYHKTCLAYLGVLALARTALAADLPPPVPPPPPVPTWTGFYAGAQIGYLWGFNNGTVTFVTPGGLAGGGNLVRLPESAHRKRHAAAVNLRSAPGKLCRFGNMAEFSLVRSLVHLDSA